MKTLFTAFALMSFALSASADMECKTASLKFYAHEYDTVDGAELIKSELALGISKDNIFPEQTCLLTAKQVFNDYISTKNSLCERFKNDKIHGQFLKIVAQMYSDPLSQPRMIVENVGQINCKDPSRVKPQVASAIVVPKKEIALGKCGYVFQEKINGVWQLVNEKSISLSSGALDRQQNQCLQSAKAIIPQVSCSRSKVAKEFRAVAQFKHDSLASIKETNIFDRKCEASIIPVEIKNPRNVANAAEAVHYGEIKPVSLIPTKAEAGSMRAEPAASIVRDTKE